MTFRPWRRDDQVAFNPFAVRFLNCKLGILANRKDRWFERHQFLISDLKKNVAWTQPCGVCGAAFVHVLEHPTLLRIKLATHESRGDSVAAGDRRTLGVAKTGVPGLQFGEEVLYLLLEFFIAGASQDLVSPAFGQFLPIRTVHTGIEVLPQY